MKFIFLKKNFSITCQFSSSLNEKPLLVLKKTLDSSLRFSANLFGPQLIIVGMEVVCPKCKKVGKLYGWKRKYKDRTYLEWAVYHDKGRHYISKDEALEVVMAKPKIDFFHYMGGDFPLLKYLAKLIPPHNCYVEVFGGAAPLLLNKSPSKVEIYNDIDGDLVNLFRVVKERFQDFMHELDWWLYSREIYYDYQKRFRFEKDPVKRAAMYFYLLRSSFSGKVIHGFSTSKIRNEASRFAHSVELLRKVHERLKKVVVERLDFREVIKRYDSRGTFFYCDPPHLYYSTEKRERDYYVERFSVADFMDLLNLLENIEGKFLLKQTSIPFILDWGEKNGYWVKEVCTPLHSKKTKGGRRENLKTLFVANYKF